MFMAGSPPWRGITLLRAALEGRLAAPQPRPLSRGLLPSRRITLADHSIQYQFGAVLQADDQGQLPSERIYITHQRGKAHVLASFELGDGVLRHSETSPYLRLRLTERSSNFGKGVCVRNHLAGHPPGGFLDPAPAYLRQPCND